MNVERILNLFPEVAWDRFTDDPAINALGVFGWLPRPDGQRDFVYIRFQAGYIRLIVTSSAKYSKDFSQRLGFTTHMDCKRVSDYFPSTRTV